MNKHTTTKAAAPSIKKILTIAGSDSSGGAGIQADIKTITAHRMYAMSAITSLTAQNTTGVTAIFDATPEFVGQELDAIFTDIRPDAVKIGMVSQPGIIRVIAQKLREYAAENIVADPVMVATSGSRLLVPEAIATLRTELLPLATVATPNIPEAEAILLRKIETLQDMEQAAREIHAMGPKAVLLKGGHRSGDATDILFDGKQCIQLEAARIPTKNTHGTGCTLSSSIAANLARGMEVAEAVAAAKKYITVAIEHALPIG